MADTPEYTEPLNPLPAEDQARANDATRSRRRFEHSPLGELARELHVAMPQYLQARAAGMTREDAARGFEGIVRELWRKPPTKFPPQCGLCEDTGRRLVTCCDQMRCGRRICADAHPAFEHEFVVPCECPAGARRQPPAEEPTTQLTAVGRAKPKAGKFNFRRLGQ